MSDDITASLKQNFGTSAKLVDTILSAITDPIVIIDESGIVRFCNSAMSGLFPKGTSILNQQLTNTIKDSPLIQIVHTGEVQRWQKIQIGQRSFLANRSPLEVAGKRIWALTYLQEVSELEQISGELKSVRLAMEELDAIIEASFDGIYVTDGEGRTLRINEAYARITGLERKDVIGYTMQDLVNQRVFDQSVTMQVIKTGKPATIIQKIRSGATVMASGMPLFDTHNNIIRIVTAVRDLTELNRLRDELSAMGSLKNQYEEELRDFKKKLPTKDDIIVRSASMRSTLDLALRLGSVDSTALIQGESGAGKEVIAEFIHRNSPRHDKPFIKINCTAIPETLLESELFGYVRGAFTGASKEGKQGLFEAAQGGTLLLDEVGDLPLALQVKLLRVIQEKQIRRVGDNTPRDIDVRLLAATNQNLPQMIKEKLFREDLYYRLNVVPIHVPPLRERKEDIVFMSRGFLQKFCKQHKRTKELHPAVLPILLEYNWPGNVRELENMIERLVVISPEKIITPEDLPEPLKSTAHAQHSPYILPGIEGTTLKKILERVEAQVLQAAFAQHKTTREIARALGIDQSSVVRKAKKYRSMIR